MIPSLLPPHFSCIAALQCDECRLRGWQATTLLRTMHSHPCKTQGVMLDIVSMLFTLIRTYIPSEIRWSYLMDLYDMFAWNICISTLLYCVFFALWCDHAPACCSPACACEPFSLPQV